MQHITNTAWVWATAKRLDEKLFTALASEAERRMGEINAHDIANTAWAFATVNLLDEKLLMPLARSAERAMS